MVSGGSERADGVHFVFGTISFDLRYLLVATIATGISFTFSGRFFVVLDLKDRRRKFGEVAMSTEDIDGNFKFKTHLSGHCVKGSDP